MGVRGLTTYIANHHKKYLKNFKLHSCYVIIDGNSLACQLYVKYGSRAHGAFGGDYDRYAHQVQEFFILLAKCEVKCVVVFDGGYEPRKINTVLSRMSERIAALKHVKPCSQDSAIVFPLFLRIVFKQVLKEMNIPFVQCDFEADQEIAGLARKYNCPVLSYDSDFYIFDVDYIPIPSIELEAVPLNFTIGQLSPKHCLNCKLYKIDYFLESFGGLDKTMLPLLACFLGNDYIKIKAFRKFYSQMKTTKGKGNPLQKKIARLIEWLRNENFESAIDKVLGRMKRIKHRTLIRSVRNVINAYTNLNVTIESYLPTEFTSQIKSTCSDKYKSIDVNMLSKKEDSVIGEDSDIEMEELNLEVSEDNSESDSEEVSDEECCETVDRNDDLMDVEMTAQIKEEGFKKVTIKFPEWLLESSRKGSIESCITDIMTLGRYFALPQIEEIFCKPSHFISLPVIKIICKLLLDNHLEEISLWTKSEGGKVQRFLLHFSETKKITELDHIPLLNQKQKQSLFLGCLNIPSEFNLDSFPDCWKLYICAIIFWIKNNSELLVTDYHLVPLCLCIVALSLVDSQVGYFRKKIGFLRKYGRVQKKLLKRIEFEYNDKAPGSDFVHCEIDEKDDIPLPYNEPAPKFESKTVKEMVRSVNQEDCITIYEELYQFHQLDENLKINKSLFSIQDIHVFAQFQSCLYHIMMLNSLLAFPFQQPVISSLYSGTFIYNSCIAFKRFKNTNKYLESILKYSPKLLNLVIEISSEISKVAPVVVQNEVVKKNRRRKRQKVLKARLVNESEKSDEDASRENSGDDAFFDENNAFSLLSSI